jgi:hypothetical protein
MKGRQCRIELDGDKISHRYKVHPYNYFSDFHSNEEPYRQASQDEQEEVIKTNDLKNISSYITGITLYRAPTDALASMMDIRGIPYTIDTQYIKDLEAKWSKYRRAA